MFRGPFFCPSALNAYSPTTGRNTKTGTNLNYLLEQFGVAIRGDALFRTGGHQEANALGLLHPKEARVGGCLCVLNWCGCVCASSLFRGAWDVCMYMCLSVSAPSLFLLHSPTTSP